jgi:hypothetical protein
MAWTTPRTWVGGELVTAAIFNTHIRDNLAWLYSGDSSGWQNVSTFPGFQNGWVDYGGTWTPTRYRKVGVFTTIQGLVKNGAVPSTIFTLPSGYRPGISLILANKDSEVGTAYCELRIQSDGQVYANVGSNGYFSVAATFMADQ